MILGVFVLLELFGNSSCTNHHLGATKASTKSPHPAEIPFSKTADGLEYKIVHDEPGTLKAMVGDYMEFHIKSYIRFPGGDSVLFDSRKMNNDQPVPFTLTAPAFKGDLSEGLMMLTKGDSAVFRIPVDSLLSSGNQPLPWMERGKRQMVEYTVMVTDLKAADQLKKEQALAATKQAIIDEQLIKEYLGKQNIKASRTVSGLYYKVDKMGTGPLPQTGSTVSMNYTGMTLDGNKFDSNTEPEFKHLQAFEFKLGTGQVIKGWDEGIALMPKGTKGTLYIPSTMAYGTHSPTPLIPANAVLVFDVEVVDVH